MVLPGQYEVRLTVGGQTLRRPITVKLDPRLTYSTQELKRQLDLAQKIAAGMKATYAGYGQVTQLHDQLADRIASLKSGGKSADALTAAQALDAKTEGLTDAAAGIGPMNRDLTRLLIAVDQSDSPPASELIETFAQMCQDTRAALGRWNDLRTQDVPKLNAMLTQQSLAVLTVPGQAVDASCGN